MEEKHTEAGHTEMVRETLEYLVTVPTAADVYFLHSPKCLTWHLAHACAQGSPGEQVKEQGKGGLVGRVFGEKEWQRQRLRGGTKQWPLYRSNESHL